MAFDELWAVGRDRLDLATALLQRIGLADPAAFLEAADLQWWWRTPRPSDHRPQRFWLDSDRRPVAAVIATDWADSRTVDLIALPEVRSGLLAEMWAHALAAEAPFEIAVATDDAELRRLVLDAGFTPDGGGGFVSSLPADRAPAISAAPEGFRLTDRARQHAEPHHMIGRSGPETEARLAETSLYRPDLDLFVTGPDGDVAAYGLFWLDPVTGYGLVEPMRTEDAYQGRGLARLVLTSGIARLVAGGARQVKIGHLSDNPVSAGLYRSVGFEPYCEYETYAAANDETRT